MSEIGPRSAKMKELVFYMSRVKIRNFRPNIFKLLDFIFSHISFNGPLIAINEIFGDFVGPIVDAANMFNNHGIWAGIRTANKSFALSLNQMEAFNFDLFHCSLDMLIFDNFVLHL